MNNRKLIYPILIFLLIFSGCSQSSPAENQQKPLSQSKYMLGTRITVKLYDHQDKALLDKIFNRVAEIENKMSLNIEDSELNTINNQAGKKAVKVSSDLYQVLQSAKHYAQISKGAYDPTIGPLVELWGIGSKNQQVPNQNKIEKKLSSVDYTKLKLLKNNKVKLAAKEMKLDLGGIAKGYAADEINEILAANNVQHAIINLGGNIYVRGKKINGNQWRVAIQNPFKVRGSYIGIVHTSDQAVVSSGDYERYFESDGKKYHHILNRKTGYPTRNQIRGVSVISNQAIDADALSTALFVLGIDKGLDLVKKLEGIEALYITNDRQVYLSSGLENKFELTDDNFQLNKNS